jgi:hypothetical protein
LVVDNAVAFFQSGDTRNQAAKPIAAALMYTNTVIQPSFLTTLFTNLAESNPLLMSISI